MRQKMMSAVALVAIFAVWEALCLALGISDLILPRPSQIAAVLAEKMPLLWPHTVQTLKTTVIGFALGVGVGILLGVLIGSSRLAYDVAYPLLVGFSSIPKVAVVPIFVVWFGAGTVPAILTSMVISIFPVVVNVATGLASTEPELEDVLKVLADPEVKERFNSFAFEPLGWSVDEILRQAEIKSSRYQTLIAKAKITLD